MNSFLPIICFLTILPEASTSKNQLPDYLERLNGTPITYYSQGSEAYATHLQKLLNNAISYFGASTVEQVEFELIVLSQSDAQALKVQWPMPFSTDDRVYMPSQGFFKTELIHSSLPESNFHISDFIAIHELGHLYWHKRTGWHDDKVRFKNHKWFGEFIADYYMMGYMVDHLSSDEYPKWLSLTFKYLPFRYKTLEDFELQYSKLPKTNYVIYQNKFNEIAFNIFKEKQWDFIPEMYHLYDSLSIEGIDRKTSFPVINNYIASINSDTADWFKGMRHTWHPFLLGIVLSGLATSSFFKLKKSNSMHWFSRALTMTIFALSLICLLIFSAFYFI
jgi:hypothetical protein